jgi:hypothetical protein
MEANFPDFLGKMPFIGQRIQKTFSSGQQSEGPKPESSKSEMSENSDRN